MFKIIGIIVVMAFFFKIGKRVRSNRRYDSHDSYDGYYEEERVERRKPRKISREVKTAIKDEAEDFKKYFYEVVYDETGEKRRVRMVEAIDRREFNRLRDEVED